MRDIGYIYFIQASGTDRYKIGLTTREPQERLKELNSSQSAYPLVLIDSIHVSNVRAVEKQLHQDFKNCRVHGEWFELTTDEVMKVRSRMLALKFSQDDIPIITTRPQQTVFTFQSPGREWFLPLLIALGIVFVIRQCTFLQPATVSPNQSELIRTNRK